MLEAGKKKSGGPSQLWNADAKQTKLGDGRYGRGKENRRWPPAGKSNTAVSQTGKQRN